MTDIIHYNSNHDVTRASIDDLARFVYLRALDDKPRPKGERALFAEYMVDVVSRRHDVPKSDVTIEWLDHYADRDIDVPIFTLEMKWHTTGLHN